MAFSDTEHRLLTELQFSFPVCPSPWRVLGERVGLDEADVLSLVRDLRGERDVIRRISGVFEGRKLGYSSALVAGKVCPERIAGSAAVIATHPGVSHNYERDGEFNLWYTIAVPRETSLEATVDRLGDLAALEKQRILPELVRYKIGVKLDTGRPNPGEREEIGDPVRPSDEPAPDFSETDRASVRALQEDLPLEPRPFAVLADRAGIGEDDFLEWIERFREDRRLRRIAAIVRHRNVGYVANAMGVWRVPDDRADDIGRVMASFRRVSHCYRRPHFPDWPYQLYTMIHGLSQEDCEKVAALISKASGVREYRLLYSGREFKKTRVRYFVPEFGAWSRLFLTGEAGGSTGASTTGVTARAMRTAALKIRSRDEAARLAGVLKTSGRTIVIADGCFDVLSVGDIRFLDAAASLGDVLIVGIRTDESVRALMGAGRPILPERERILVVAALRSVSHVVLYSEPTPDGVLRQLAPDIYAVRTGDSGESAPAREAVRSSGGKVVEVGDAGDYPGREPGLTNRDDSSAE